MKWVRFQLNEFDSNIALRLYQVAYRVWPVNFSIMEKTLHLGWYFVYLKLQIQFLDGSCPNKLLLTGNIFFRVGTVEACRYYSYLFLQMWDFFLSISCFSNISSFLEEKRAYLHGLGSHLLCNVFTSELQYIFSFYFRISDNAVGIWLLIPKFFTKKEFQHDLRQPSIVTVFNFTRISVSLILATFF